MKTSTMLLVGAAVVVVWLMWGKKKAVGAGEPEKAGADDAGASGVGSFSGAAGTFRTPTNDTPGATSVTTLAGYVPPSPIAPGYTRVAYSPIAVKVPQTSGANLGRVTRM